jgi:cytochrome c-type biogenesis protein
MPDANVTIGIAFIAGVVSFLAPCVLPIVPGFLAYLAGASATEVEAKRRQIFANALFFVLGFSAVFAALGVALNTILEAVAYDVQIWLSRVGGIIIIFFGLYLTGLVKLPFLEREHKLRVKQHRSRLLTSFLFGAAFAAGWTPCVGAALGSILGLAATQPGLAFILLMSYALGLGIPFLVVALFAGQAAVFLNRLARAVKYINLAFGILLIAFGVLVFTQSLNLIANFDFLNTILL